MRVHRSFAFVDVSGFTALTEHEGDEHAVDVLTAFRALLRDICARRGVRIAKWLGDGVMLVCVDTRPLLETVLELHHIVGAVSGPVETVSIRSGINSGEVILMEGDDYVGRAVNVAARMCEVAEPGQVIAWVKDLRTPPWVAATPLGPFRVKGIAGAVDTVALSIQLDPSRPVAPAAPIESDPVALSRLGPPTAT